MTRRLISSGGPWEKSAGYSRAVVIGDVCRVSGTTDAGPDGRSQNPGDPGAQARAAFAIVERALAEGGFTLADVRPAATLVIVTALIDPSLLIEVEVDAMRSP